jgi:hypothetical protein
MKEIDKSLKIKKTASQIIDDFELLSTHRKVNRDYYGGALIVTEDLSRLDLDTVKNEEVIRDLKFLQKMPYGDDTRDALLNLADNCGNHYIEEFVNTYKSFKDKKDAKGVFDILLNHVDELEVKDFIEMASEFPSMQIDDKFLYKALEQISNRRTLSLLYICSRKNLSVTDEDKFIDAIIDKTHPDFIHLLSQDIEEYCGEVKDEHLLAMFDRCPEENVWDFIDKASCHYNKRDGNAVNFSRKLLYLLSDLDENKKLNSFDKIVKAVVSEAPKMQKKEIMSTAVNLIGNYKISELYKTSPELAKNVCMFLNELEQKQKRIKCKNSTHCKNTTYSLDKGNRVKSFCEVLTYNEDVNKNTDDSKVDTLSSSKNDINRIYIDNSANITLSYSRDYKLSI